MKLKWNDAEQCYECPCCGGLFSKDELARAWDYQEDCCDFHPTYCMDCGTRWDSVEKK